MNAPQEYALVVQQEGKPQYILAKFAVMLLNYQYGLYTQVVHDLVEAASAFALHGKKIRCVFVIQNQKISSQTSLMGLNQRGEVPLILLVPNALIGIHRRLCEGAENVTLCAWEGFAGKKGGLRQSVAEAFKENGFSGMLQDAEGKSYDDLQQGVEARIKDLKSLPAMPEVILRIMRMVNDPKATVKELEAVLFTDPSIVQKLIQVFNSAAFAGAGHHGKWTFEEGIVRLGMKKVGAIAMQVKMMNSFVKPEGQSVRPAWLLGALCGYSPCGR